MKQSQSGPKGSTKTAKPKRKTRADLNIEARDRKRQKKHRGNASGARTNVESGADKNGRGGATPKDPRIGSKTPVPLIVESNKPVVAKVAKPKAPKQPKIAPEKELALLEQDERLNQLLDAVDEGKTLSAEDQSYVDNTLDRIDELMSELGIDLGDEGDDLLDGADEEEKREDIVQLLKRSSSKE
ncbi:Der GTPase-activating protein YihI [Budvicia diplopodorum]|uniref:Der GTPase-activating protein YihI n=1 Tax=Budvicia diplopodorum TaxID=1119056 RepID=UPI0013578C0E|nr:Der GTPase-activating protein YihI [Budvicia diplopodorum]